MTAARAVPRGRSTAAPEALTSGAALALLASARADQGEGPVRLPGMLSAMLFIAFAASGGASVRPEPAVVEAGRTFRCTPVAVWDGDGPVWCAEGPRVRIAGVAAREIDGSCRPGQPCPPAGGTEARDRLVGLFGGARGTSGDGHIAVRSAPMTCISEGSAGGSRTAAWCMSPAFGDLSCAVVRAGGAVRWPRYWRDHRC